MAMSDREDAEEEELIRLSHSLLPPPIDLGLMEPTPAIPQRLTVDHANLPSPGLDLVFADPPPLTVAPRRLIYPPMPTSPLPSPLYSLADIAPSPKRVWFGPGDFVRVTPDHKRLARELVGEDCTEEEPESLEDYFGDWSASSKALIFAKPPATIEVPRVWVWGNTHFEVCCSYLWLFDLQS